MLRGEIWWADIEEASGSAPAYRRPVLIVQSDVLNRSSINTVVVVALTTNMAHAKAPGNISMPRKETGLPRDSVINVSQVFTIDKSRLEDRVARVSGSIMRHVEAGLRLVLELG